MHIIISIILFSMLPDILQIHPALKCGKAIYWLKNGRIFSLCPHISQHRAVQSTASEIHYGGLSSTAPLTWHLAIPLSWIFYTFSLIFGGRPHKKKSHCPSVGNWVFEVSGASCKKHPSSWGADRYEEEERSERLIYSQAAACLRQCRGLITAAPWSQINTEPHYHMCK